jgi:choline transporter-like protein 2/4/5
VASLNKIEIDSKFPQAKNLVWEKQVTYACLGMFFGILWITAVIDYTSRFIVIMGAVTYYFNNHRDSEDQKGASIMFGVKAAYINHHGSIAFAGFIIAVIRFIKYCFYYAAKKAEKVTGENPVAKCAVKCAMCILNCIEKIVDYINENALCYQAVTGEWFCPAAYNGFILNLKHGAEFIFVKIIAKVFIFIGKVGITVGNCFSCYAIMKYITEDLDELSSVWTPIIMVGAVTYIAACLFLALYEEAVQSLLVCVCVDMDMNGDGIKSGEPKFGPKTFHDNYKKKVTDKMNKTNDME